ncbi:MAG: acylphosphatase [Chloroflexi bacterium]|nr:acylphosphatase [Chloroflexota bacterium]
MAGQVCLVAEVHGYVQGVGFRFWVLRQAIPLGLVGYVRNTWGGTVEVVAEGTPEAAQSLLEKLRRGPPGAEVERVDIRWEPARGGLHRFEIR